MRRAYHTGCGGQARSDNVGDLDPVACHLVAVARGEVGKRVSKSDVMSNVE